MLATICSVPTESPGAERRRKQSDGQAGIMPKIAITSLLDWAEKNGFSSCKFYDIDMLYPSDADIEKYFRENKADVVGLSAVVSTSYLQVKRIAKIIKKVNCFKEEIACGVMFRKETLFDIGLYNESFKMREGHELKKDLKKNLI